jgi:hypothetical protein
MDRKRYYEFLQIASAETPVIALEDDRFPALRNEFQPYFEISDLVRQNHSRILESSEVPLVS